jgi:hypothetical protein
MSFNHYAKLARIIEEQQPGWYIQKIDEPTTSKRFNGETRHHSHYYRLFTASGEIIKYGKFQQLDRLAAALKISPEELPLIN